VLPGYWQGRRRWEGGVMALPQIVTTLMDKRDEIEGHIKVLWAVESDLSAVTAIVTAI
jgi:hypothetical protein